MSRYRLNPAHSDQPLQDGDGAFLRFASRRQSTQLPEGYLELSVNMQLDRTTAKVRPAIAPAVTDISLTNPPLVLDFTLAADIAIVSITLVGATATATTSSAHGYATGNQVNIRNTVAPEYSGDFIITVTGATTFTYTIAGAPATPELGPVVVDAATKNGGFEVAGTGGQPFADWVTTGASITRDLVTFRTGTASCKYAGQPLGFSADNITVTGLVAGRTYTISLYAKAASINTARLRLTAGATVPAIGATLGVAFAQRSLTFVPTGTTASITMSNPFGGASSDTYIDDVTIYESPVANKGPIVFEDYASSVRCSCMFATRNTDRTEYAILASTTQAYAVRAGVASQSILFPANETIESTDDASMIYWNGRVFLFRGYQQAAALVISSITQVAGTATCTTASAHGFATNDWVYLEEVIPYGYGGIVQVTVTGGTTFTYAVNALLASPATTTTAASKVRKCKRPLYWDGNFANAFVAVTTGPIGTGGTYIHLPPVPWAIDIHNRLLIPWRADQFLFSDPYDSDTYDTIYEQFRLRYGSFDQIIAAVPAPNSVVFALARRSLHRIILDENNLAIGAAEEITRDVGCLARRTVRSHGGSIIWLGDRAIHRVRITDQLNLIPEEIPLSDDVQDIIDSVNWSYATKATAIVWNNRYYLALPTGTDTLNTVVLVYNFINQGWESKHTYPAGFDVEEWHLMDSGGQKKLFASTTFGFLYDMASATATTDSFGNTSSQQSYTISGSFDTRYYTGGTKEVKRCRRMFLEANLGVGDAFTAQIIARNPDLTGDVVTVTSTTVNDGRYPIYGGLSGSGHKLRVTTTGGRPEFRAVECEFSAVRERHYNPQT